jgi:hypothetical protein
VLGKHLPTACFDAQDMRRLLPLAWFRCQPQHSGSFLTSFGARWPSSCGRPRSCWWFRLALPCRCLRNSPRQRNGSNCFHLGQALSERGEFEFSVQLVALILQRLLRRMVPIERT